MRQFLLFSIRDCVDRLGEGRDSSKPGMYLYNSICDVQEEERFARCNDHWEKNNNNSKPWRILLKTGQFLCLLIHLIGTRSMRSVSQLYHLDKFFNSLLNYTTCMLTLLHTWLVCLLLSFAKTFKQRSIVPLCKIAFVGWIRINFAATVVVLTAVIRISIIDCMY